MAAARLRVLAPPGSRSARPIPGGLCYRDTGPTSFLPPSIAFFPRNGIRLGETAFAGASLPPVTGHSHSPPASSGHEEGIPCRLPLPEGVRAMAPASVPAAARAPVGGSSEGVGVGVVDQAAAGRVVPR